LRCPDEPTPWLQFLGRHVGIGNSETFDMLRTVNPSYNSLEDLVNNTVPMGIRLHRELQLPPPATEAEALAEMREIARRNSRGIKSFIGMGYYGTITPSVILRNILENPGWYTSYTPYQAEISQGRLEMLINFQTMVADLTGMDIANASLLDEATACAEGMAMATNVNPSRKAFFVSSDVFPHTIALLRTRGEALGVEVVVGNPEDVEDWSRYTGVLLQYPNSFGHVRDFEAVATNARAAKALVVAATDLMALTLLKPPGEWGADIAVGSSQRFGVPMGYGGPHAAFFACRDEFKRRMPGRVIGVSKDSRGKPAYRMSMQTREQHIRRDKATSNICTAQALLANTAAAYGVYHGPDGLVQIANRIWTLTSALAEGLRRAGFTIGSETGFFDTIDVVPPSSLPLAETLVSTAESLGYNLRLIEGHYIEPGAVDTSRHGRIGIALDETATPEDVVSILVALSALPRHALAATGAGSTTRRKLAASTPIGTFVGDGLEAAARSSELARDALGGRSVEEYVTMLAEEGSRAAMVSHHLQRTTEFMTHPVFSDNRSETQMLRYLKRLENKDLSLTHSMISLGSCTMKLNAAAEMIPITFPEFADAHPFAPEHQVEGFRALIDSLNEWLAEITGFAAVSAQPNSGAQGEYAGLMTIRHYLKDQGEGHRDICLIPNSAHGTNPASAVAAGLKVVTVESMENGDIDFADLTAKAEKYKDRLAAFMVTYPSTFGVFEAGIVDMCEVIHKNGGQVYMDGANMNAQVGLTSPARIGADVCHLNLHKTFCIPHGGGGPGVGAIGVAKHLAPFLPGHQIVPTGGTGTNIVAKRQGAVSAAPFGSALILPIPWMYIRMLGSEGLRKATSYAILNANYVAKSLEDHFPILFRGASGNAAHEFILDLRPFRHAGIKEEDVAKRLMDFGFHAPTMSWPVPGTLMIEPTESEDREELDRFIQSMLYIRKEIADVVEGRIKIEDSPLRNAPHTSDMVINSGWNKKYSVEQAAFPLPWVRTRKFWPTVGRIDNVYGDRHLVCSCPPVSAFASDVDAELEVEKRS
jgi:glycine dehydrogenase